MPVFTVCKGPCHMSQNLVRAHFTNTLVFVCFEELTIQPVLFRMIQISMLMMQALPRPLHIRQLALLPAHPLYHPESTRRLLSVHPLLPQADGAS